MKDSQNNPNKKEFRIKGGDKILSIIKSFSATEKAVFSFFILIALISSLIIANKVNKSFLVPEPTFGGTLNEGIIGLPRSINPVLSFTDTDRDISALVYSGLMKYENGKLVGDLAGKYSVSSDGLTYSFTLRDDIRFHDGVQLTTDDVEFTIQKIQDNIIKSPRMADWANITIQKINSREIQFILKQPYAPFLSNTTIGILPKHIWKNTDGDQFIYNQYNTNPIGSGPYKINNINKDSNGIPTSYTLIPFDRFYNGEAFISSLNLFFFANEKLAIDAYNAGTIQSLAGISPQEASKISSSNPSVKILSSPLPRLFGIFFNQNSAPVLTNKEVRQALDIAVDRQSIIKKVLSGYGVAIDGPLPSDITNDSTSTNESNKEKAKAILAKAGWVLDSNGVLEKKDKKSTQILEFSISTSDTPDLKDTAEIVKADWESIGAKVDIKVFEYGDLSQNIIKTRKYDALLFGESINKGLDLYAFWHSSQRNAPGLNVAMYVNSKVDKLLEDARATTDESVKNSKYDDFQKIITDEIPAVFLYSPEYIYIVPNDIQNITFNSITSPSDRWHGIEKWYIATDSVWKIFVKK